MLFPHVNKWHNYVCIVTEPLLTFKLSRMTTIKKMLISFTAGAVLGMLYAPAKGSKTRRKLGNVGNEIKEGWNTIADGISGTVDNFRDGIDQTADNIIEKVDSTQFQVNDKAGFL